MGPTHERIDAAAAGHLTVPALHTTTPAWVGEGNQDSCDYANCVAGAGDVNGDGWADIIVGAFTWTGAVPDEGAAFVHHGSSSGLGSAPAWMTVSGINEAEFGWSVAAAGDVNGDGYGDVLVGADFLSDALPLQGRVYLYLGSSTGLGALPSWTVDGLTAGDRLGTSVATAGDVNADGFADVILGAPNATTALGEMGRVDLYLGSPVGLPPSPSQSLLGTQAGALFGLCVAPAGDLDGDGHADIIIGSPNFANGEPREGQVVAFRGSPAGLDTTPWWTVERNDADAAFGWSVSGAGDLNGDGFPDVVVGSRPIDSEPGEATAYHGSAAGLPSTPSWVAYGVQVGERFGVAVAGLGDVNGDGFADVAVGADGWDGGEEDEGRVVVFQGGPVGLGAAPAWEVEADEARAELGATVAATGDVNNDGFDDIIMGGIGFENPEPNEGRAIVFHGSPAGLGGGTSLAATCPADIRVPCPSAVPPAATDSVMAGGGCGAPLVVVHVSDAWSGGCPEVVRRSYRVTDACGAAVECMQEITIADGTPPTVLAGSAGTRCIDPSHHGWACFTRADLEPTIVDGCGSDTSWRFSGCESDQPADDRGDGSTGVDCLVAADGGDACIRVERQGTRREGRTYRLSVIATDACGNISSPVVAAYVRVLHDGRDHLACEVVRRRSSFDAGLRR